MCEGDKLLNREPESEVKENGLKATKISGEILDDLGAEGSISGKIGEVLTYHFEHGRSREEIKEEISIYIKDIKPRLTDKELNTLFNTLIDKRLLPSRIFEEFKAREEILNEPESEVREFMKKSLGKNVFPSIVLAGKDAYKRLIKIKNEDERRIITYYLENGYSPEGVEEKYEDYVYIKNYEYKNPELRSFILSLINDNGVDPSLVAYYFSIIKDKADFGEDDKEYILRLINTPGF